MSPIPKTAKPIADYIRENVGKPDCMWQAFISDEHDNEGIRFSYYHSTEDFTVLGLMDAAVDVEHPEGRHDFVNPPDCFTDRGIKSFNHWCDKQTDLQAAINAIWEESKQKS